MKPRNWLVGIFVHYFIAIGVAVLVLPPVRNLLRRFVYKPGEGPNKEESMKDYLELRGVANPDGAQSKKQAVVKAWYEGSMYFCECPTSKPGVQTRSQANHGPSDRRPPRSGGLHNHTG
jgi:hypothetical protein